MRVSAKVSLIIKISTHSDSIYYIWVDLDTIYDMNGSNVTRFTFLNVES